MEKATQQQSDPFRDMLQVMRKAFGAPGDHGYDTKEGKALFALYNLLSNSIGSEEVLRHQGLSQGMAMSIAFMLRGGNETEAHEWWHACGLTVAELEAIGVDDYDLDPIRIAGLDPDHCVSFDDCPGHVAAAHDTKICGRCGIHIDELRPDDDDPFNLAGSGPLPIAPREG